MLSPEANIHDKLGSPEFAKTKTLVGAMLRQNFVCASLLTFTKITQPIR